jgi:hypothetical protein
MFPPKVTNGQALNIKNYVCKMKTVDSTFKTMVLNKVENYLNSGVLTNPPADAKGHLKWYYELIGPLQSTEKVNNNSFEGLIMDGDSL